MNGAFFVGRAGHVARFFRDMRMAIYQLFPGDVKFKVNPARWMSGVNRLGTKEKQLWPTCFSQTKGGHAKTQSFEISRNH